MFKWLLENSLTNRLLVIIASVCRDGLRRVHAVSNPGGRVPRPQQADRHHHDGGGWHGRRGGGAAHHLPAGNDHERSARRGERALNLVSRPVLPLRHLRLEHRHLPCPAAGVGAVVVDGGRHCRRRGAAHGPDQLDHGRDHADRHSGRSEQDQPDGRARVRRLGVAPSAAVGARRRTGHPHRRRGAAVPGAAEHHAHGELGITHDQLEGALKGYSSNTSGGFLELNGREYLIRNLGRTSRLDDLKNLALTSKNGQPILMRQIAEVTFAAALKRGDAGYEGKPAVILGIQKQPTADTIALTKSIEDALVGLKASLPAGMEAPRVTFRQASFIEASITTLQGKLIGASIFVAVILFFFLGTLRPTIIALTAIPVSIFITALVFKYFGLSINTMTLGGLAIAIGGLVDDAVVVWRTCFGG
jgi:hypothetical protein